MTHLVLRADYNNEYRGEEFSPTHFVLKIEPDVVKHLQNLVVSTRSLKENHSKGIELIDCNFYFDFGIWTEWNETLEDLSREELVWVDDLDYLLEDDEELREQQFLSETRVSVDKEGNLQFFCFGKYDDEQIYTCRVNLYSEIQTQLADKEM